MKNERKKLLDYMDKNSEIPDTRLSQMVKVHQMVCGGKVEYNMVYNMLCTHLGPIKGPREFLKILQHEIETKQDKDLARGYRT